MNAPPYRAAALVVVPPASLLPPMRDDCPECGLHLAGLRCVAGHQQKRLVYRHICNELYCHAELPDPVLVRYCSPYRRLRFGFLWLRKCRHPGTHIHQLCPRCGWRAVSRAGEHVQGEPK